MWSSLLSIILVVNELMASNAGVVMSPATNFDSWIELYNPGEQPVYLGGMYLSNDASKPMLWQIPANIGTIPAKGFKVVWLGSNDIKSNQAPFKLDCDGGTVYLSDTKGELITSQTYPQALSRTAWARKSDGGEDWGWTAQPTPGATNAMSIFATERLAPPIVSDDSKLFTGSLQINVEIPEGATLVYTTDGSVPTPPQVAVQHDDTGNHDGNEPTWTNWVRNSDCEGNDATCFICRDGDGGETPRITDGVGVNGSRGIKVHSIENPEHEWSTQFFIYTPDHVWKVGEYYRFSMRVRADKPTNISIQSQTTPGNYIYWSMLCESFDVTTEWQELTYEGEITAEQTKGDGDEYRDLQTIAFNLNNESLDNNFYFDNIVWELLEGGHTGNDVDIVVRDNPGKESKNGRFIVRNTTNYVFRLFKDGYLPSVPVTRSYIKPDNNYTIPIVSIVGDDKYFNDPMWGIDVDGINGKPGNNSNGPVNWNMAWDRPVNFSFISPEGEMLFNQDVMTSVSGGWSRSTPPRSFKLKSNKVFDGLNHLDYPFFPQKPNIRSKALLVRNGGNDGSCRFMDPAMTTIVQRSGIDLDVQSTLQVAEYINGEFRGILNLREPNNDKFVYANWGYDDEEIDYLENFSFNNGTDEAWNRLLDLSKHVNDNSVYEEIQTLLDIDEFTNYMAAELYLGNSDWPNNNVKGYRSQKDGRFRFILFDLDQIFNRWCPMSNISTLETLFANEPLVQLFRNLLRHDEYRKKFIDTFCIMGGSVFERERLTAMINEIADDMRPMLQLEGRSPDNTANEIKNKMRTRLDDAMGQLKQYEPAMTESLKQQTVQLGADTEGAHIFLNGIDLPYADFKGYLFQPVKIEAKAPVGYTFTGWKKGTSASLQLIKNNDTWKYYDKGAAPSNWTANNFNDSGWASGPAPLGYKMTGVKTTVSYGNDPDQKHPTTYFRKTISLGSTPKRSDVFLLNYQVDDGFVVYVNGKEAGRYNMHNGEVGFDSFSSSYAGDTPLTGTLELSSSLFKSGNNVIAVEIHNNSYTSSDQYWAAELLTSVGSSSEGLISSEAVMDLPADDVLTLVACFTPLSDEEKAVQGITPLRINEVSAANSVFVNEYFKHNDWVELYNTTGSPIDVEGMYLSDNLTKPKKYQISKGETLAETTIPAYGHLVVWCDKLEPLSQLHADFKLDAEGGDVILTAADESWCDQITYTLHQGNESVGRYPDGFADVYVMNIPTIAKPNILSSYVTTVEQPHGAGIHDIMADATEHLSIRYAEGYLTIRSISAESLLVRITNLAGQNVMSLPVQLAGGYAEVPVDQLPTGIFIATVTDRQGHKSTCKFIKR